MQNQKFREFDRSDAELHYLIKSAEKALENGIAEGRYIPPYECNTVLYGRLSEDYNRMTAYIAKLRSELMLPLNPLNIKV